VSESDINGRYHEIPGSKRVVTDGQGRDDDL
jgi:hypothetical protein